ncbi:hypothetical protein Pvag_1995 [Pantoea vagans C9-1]|nr:hypothetical protein Pvag_1995 [Pantoea vagans C9-1]
MILTHYLLLICLTNGLFFSIAKSFHAFMTIVLRLMQEQA